MDQEIRIRGDVVKPSVTVFASYSSSFHDEAYKAYVEDLADAIREVMERMPYEEGQAPVNVDIRYLEDC